MLIEQLWQPVPGGSGRYIVELLRELPAAGVEVLGVTARHPNSAPQPEELDLRVPVVHSRLSRRMLYAVWDQLHRPSVDPLIGRTDVVHATTWTIPPTRHPLVVTVHDVAFLRDPSHFTRHGSAYFRRALQVTRDRADLVVVPSRASALDCIEAGIGEERLRVIPHGVRRQQIAPGRVESFRLRFGLRRPYVLWVGTREPRKNLPVLLQAYSLLVGHSDLDLVLVGPSGWGATEAENKLLASLPSDRVHLVGRVDDQDLLAAYAGARVFCFPSTWEGFGLPVLEAMSQGVPVVTSRGTSMAEITGEEAGILADPLSAGEMAGALEAAAGPEHGKLAIAGRRRAAAFTWERSARAHAAAYGELA